MTSGSVILVAVLFTVSSGVFSPFVSAIACTKLCCFSGLGVIVGLNVRRSKCRSVQLCHHSMSFLGATFFDPATLPDALKVIVYLP